MTSAEGGSAPLHPLERALLGGLAKSAAGEWILLQEAADQSGISIDQTRRAAEWLKEKGYVSTKDDERISYSLGEAGRNAAGSGLPERKIVGVLNGEGGSADLESLAKLVGPEFSVALGRAKKNGWISLDKNRVSLLPKSVNREPEELVLEKIAKLGHVPTDQLSAKELDTASALIKRLKGLIEEAREKEIYVRLTGLGQKLSLGAVDEIDSITPQVLKSGEWKSKPIRKIDVTSPAPRIYPGRRHPMRLFMDEVREAFVSLGFEEILGPISQSAFWNFDALFIPQKHSARDMQDTFYVSGAKANLSSYRRDLEQVRAVHEYGADTGSTGWGYEWSEEEARRVLLRTHTTAVTISYLAEYKPENARVFSVGKVYRNEKPNYKHNPEFSQIEGVMVGKDLNLRNLIYTISKFYSKLGFNKIKFWPTYFPYTEPSLQTMAYYEPTKSWMELGGMGMFRPEVTLPLGVKNPVLAWGLGMDRLVMLRYGVQDVRLLFGSNLGWLRSLKLS